MDNNVILCDHFRNPYCDFILLCSISIVISLFSLTTPHLHFPVSLFKSLVPCSPLSNAVFTMKNFDFPVSCSYSRLFACI